ncbi:MAG: DNA polymerase IV [Erysipelothrix sp.]|nr:DNA polymerase IV [Erysipelothrix sp.]
MSARVIFHIDINAFFANAHIIEDPTLEGLPIVVCNNVKGAVITTASYEARKFGVGSAMPLSQAKRLCPQLKIIDINFKLYVDLSRKFVDIIQSYSEDVQQASIDEVFVDLTEKIKEYKHPLDLAVEIQKRVFDSLKLPISIGIAPNKFLAKMASDMDKPLGITVLRKREVETKLWPLPIEDMFGIGKKTVPRLHDIQVFTIGDLNTIPFDTIRGVLGNKTQHFIDHSNGLGSSTIVRETTAKSVGQSQTFSTPIYELDELKSKIIHEIENLEARAKKYHLKGKTIQFAIRFEDSDTAARSISLDYYINDKEEILERVMALYEMFHDKHHKGVTFISITLNNIKVIDEIEEQLNIFSLNKDLDTDTMIDNLNENFGGGFARASTLFDKK